MKVLIVYDSFFGNTEQIARAIGQMVYELYDLTPEEIRIIEGKAK
ncbi:MAG: hypothetical protein Q7J65_00050 [Candidatus Marinimicrobia bacterium]|nr:hypothetical protein [Candidatus Neomarinimicrobiota bacterium]